MKAQSFEYQLRHTAPSPAPDPAARLSARRAALLEFERVHVQPSKPSPTARGGSWNFFRTLASRNSLMGGVATACVLVIGVSVVWLMPPEEREVQLNLPAASEPERRSPSNEVSRTSERALQASSEVPPASQSARPTERQAEQSPASARSAQTKGKAPEIAQGTIAAQGSSQGNSNGPATPSRQFRDEREQSSSQFARVEPAPMPADVPPAPPIQLSPEELRDSDLKQEVIVTGSRIQGRALHSPTPITTVESDVLQESVVTASRISGRGRDRSTRKASVSEAYVGEPASEGRDKFQHFELNPVKRVVDDAVSTFSVDVDTASYSFVRRQLNQGTLPQVDAVRVEEMINYFDYAWPVPESRDQPFTPTVTVSDSPWGEGKKLIHIGIKGYALPVRQQPDVNLVLLLDVSGSMDSPDKLPLAQRSMALLLDSLKPTDTVAIVVYAGAAGQVLAPTPVEEKETILRALSSLRPGGSTAGAAGIRLAYELAEKNFRKDGVNRILLATDGDFNVGITDPNELKGFVEREREKGVYLSVLGFGEGNYRDEMAQALAQNGNGVAAYVDTLSEARKVLVHEATASLFPIAKDVKLQVEFNPATVAEYRLVGYETRALKREDFNNDKVDAGDVGAGHTVTAIYEITPVGSKASLADESRYAGREKTSSGQQGKANEYGYLKIRYKLPKGFRSRLLQQPILVDAGVPAALEKDVEFSTAVAGFAQLLRGGKYTGSLELEDVIRQAEGALGADRYEYRAEFVELVRKAQRARGM